VNLNVPVPLLLRLLHHYYVVDCSGEVYDSLSFTEAYLLWLARCVAHRLIAPKNIHAKIRTALGYFGVA